MKIRYLIFLLLAILALSIFVQLSLDRNSGSVYSSKPHGAKGFLLLLRHLQVETSVWLHPYSKLDAADKDRTLFVVSPTTFGAADSLKEWVLGGNRLVYMGPRYSDIGNMLFMSESKEKPKADTTSPQEPSQQVDAPTRLGSAVFAAIKQITGHANEPLNVICGASAEGICDGVAKISVFEPVEKPDFHNAEIVLGSPQEPLVVRKRVGRGDLWYFAQDTLIRNDRIDEYDNLRLLFQLATEGQDVIFDEFHHGFTTPVSPAMRARRDSVYVFAFYLLFFLILAALSRSFRFGPPHEPCCEMAPSITEFTTALGFLYSEHQAAAVLKNYLLSWKRRAAEQFGISERLSDDSFAAEIAARSSADSIEGERLSSAMNTLCEGMERDIEVMQDSVRTLEQWLEQRE